MMMTRAVTVAGGVLAVAVLFGAELAGQTTAPPTYRQLAGCSEEPAQFHRCAPEKTKTFNPPRTPDGAPDFRGVWSRSGVTTDNIEEHVQSFENPAGKSLVVDPADGRIPYQPWAAARKRDHDKIYVDPQANCFPPGSPRQAYAPGGYQILQSPGYLTFLLDYAHVHRVVPIDARPHVAPSIRLSMGDSRGRWEGNTLVVDITNLNAMTWFDHVGNFYSDNVHIVERWTLIDTDAIHYEATLDDAKVYTRPWTIAFGIRRNTEPRYEMMEVACYEGSVGRVPGASVGLKPYPGVTYRK